MENKTIIEVDNICKKFTNQNNSIHYVLNNISFNLKKGDALAIIGKNGSGKSTLLKILSRIIQPSSGTAIIYGNYTSILDIGNGFHPDLTGRENIKIYHTLISENTSPNIEKIIAFSELESVLDTPVKYYSNGMYLRLAFSIAIHAQTDILLIDEVLAVGDNLFMNKCYEKILSKRKEGCTFIIASHNINDLSKLCNKGIWLDNSKIAYQGDIGNTISEYLNSIYNQIELKNTYHTNNDINEHSINIIYANIYSLTPRNKPIYNFEDQLFVDISIVTKLHNYQFLCALEIEDESGAIIATLGSVYSYITIKKKGSHMLSLSIPKMLLNIGIYRMSIRFLNNDTVYNQYFKNIFIFRIIQTNHESENIQQANPFKIICGDTQWKLFEL